MQPQICGNESFIYPRSIKDLKHWKKAGDVRIQKRIQSLLRSIEQNPFDGIGKPEPLKYSLTGLWSRRITHEDRLVYEIVEDLIIIHSLKGHY